MYYFYAICIAAMDGTHPATVSLILCGWEDNNGVPCYPGNDYFSRLCEKAGLVFPGPQILANSLRKGFCVEINLRPKTYEEAKDDCAARNLISNGSITTSGSSMFDLVASLPLSSGIHWTVDYN